MKRIDFEHGTVTGNILGAALPMLVAQILNLLYNIVDRIYIARIPNVGTAALGAVGLCFPLIVVITAFSNLFGSGGAPLFSIYRGKNESQKSASIMNTSFTMVVACAVVLMLIAFICQTASCRIWRIKGCPSLCLSVFYDLSNWNTAIYDCHWYESIYQCTGLLDNRYDLNCRRGYCQSPIRSIIYFCFGLWCAGCRDCNCDFSISVGCICTVFPDKKNPN